MHSEYKTDIIDPQHVIRDGFVRLQLYTIRDTTRHYNAWNMFIYAVQICRWNNHALKHRIYVVA